MDSKSKCPKIAWYFYDVTSELTVSLSPYVGTGLPSSKEERPHAGWEGCQHHIVHIRACGMRYMVEIWKIRSSIIYSLAIKIHICPTCKIHSTLPVRSQSLITLQYHLSSPGSHYLNPVHVRWSSLGVVLWHELLGNCFSLPEDLERPVN